MLVLSRFKHIYAREWAHIIIDLSKIPRPNWDSDQARFIIWSDKPESEPKQWRENTALGSQRLRNPGHASRADSLEQPLTASWKFWWVNSQKWLDWGGGGSLLTCRATSINREPYFSSHPYNSLLLSDTQNFWTIFASNLPFNSTNLF